MTAMGRHEEDQVNANKTMLVLLATVWLLHNQCCGMAVLPTHSLRQAHRSDGGPVLVCGVPDIVSRAAALCFRVGSRVIVCCHILAPSLLYLSRSGLHNSGSLLWMSHSKGQHLP